MAKTDAERARDYRARKKAALGIVPVMPVSDFEEFKEKARQLAEQDRAQIAALQDQVAELEEIAAGKRIPPCTSCGGPLACPHCSRGDDF